MGESKKLKNSRTVETIDIGGGRSVRLRSNRTEEETRAQLSRIENYANRYFARNRNRYFNNSSAIARAVRGMSLTGRWQNEDIPF